MFCVIYCYFNVLFNVKVLNEIVGVYWFGLKRGICIVNKKYIISYIRKIEVLIIFVFVLRLILIIMWYGVK